MLTSDAVRLRWLTVTVACGILAALLTAPRLWFAHPFFGPLPPLSWLPAWPAWLDTPFYATLAVLMLPIALGRQTQRYAALWCALFAIRAAFDLTVWQPYFYQYAAMLFAFCLLPRPTDAINLDRLIMVSVYWWSGAHKLNYWFVSAGLNALPGLETLLTPLRPVVSLGLFEPIIVAIPLIEMAIGVGLLVGGRGRRLAVCAAIAMHSLVLLALGPLGRNQNPVVWPWNVAMIVLVLVLFAGDTAARDTYRAILWNPRARVHQFALIAFGLCPLLGAIGWWPAVLSFRLYSYRLPAADVYVTEALRTKLPAATQTLVEPVSVTFNTGRKLGSYVGGLNISDWSERELGAFVPPEPRVFAAVFDKVCALATTPTDAVLLRMTAPAILDGKTQQSLATCVRAAR